ncbi:hypothetical protein [Pseudovibrio exalbescens]|uniref:Uncharacterized protein n=1 Tax=Pseudovibrio exalbescens TaxID=197461 RepID=A0A1U7JKY4_9HYPH|nr:hypothetical protein [Pseudovibrio exalbescens]OKL45352.1 hypothetical protein A3843_03200 [Pseudovibrio exalbescens]
MQDDDEPKGQTPFEQAAARRKTALSQLFGGRDTGAGSALNEPGSAGSGDPFDDLISEIEQERFSQTETLSDASLADTDTDRDAPRSSVRSDASAPGTHNTMAQASSTQAALRTGLDANADPKTVSASAVPDETQNEGASDPASGSGGTGGGNGNGSSNTAEGEGQPMPGQALTTTTPDTSELNQQIVQAVQFTNYENANYVAEMVSVPADVMATQTAGHATQNAETYMNGIMQIAVAAQAVVAAKIAENPATAEADAPALEQLQKMVTEAITAFGKASETAGTSAAKIISGTKLSG